MRLRRRTRPENLRAALVGALRRTAVIGVLAALGLGLSGLLVHTGTVRGVEAPGTSATTTPPVEVRQTERTETLMSVYDCSTHGLGTVVPAHAIVRRTGSGGVRLVTFDRGWAAYEGRLPGLELVAVCRR